jgi:hypothetical protein
MRFLLTFIRVGILSRTSNLEMKLTTATPAVRPQNQTPHPYLFHDSVVPHKRAREISLEPEPAKLDKKVAERPAKRMKFPDSPGSAVYIANEPGSSSGIVPSCFLSFLCAESFSKALI